MRSGRTIEDILREEQELAVIQKIDGFTLDELDAAFKAVQNPNHWKDPIDAVINADRREVTAKAIVYYTATVASFSPAGEGKLRVEAAGYRKGPAGDH